MKRSQISKRFMAAGMAMLLSGCAAVGPNYVRPGAPVPSAYKELKGWRAASPRDDFDKGSWWSLFRDPELDRLIAQVSIANQSLKASEANYRQAVAMIAEARAQLFPTLSFNPAASRSNPGINSVSAEASGSWTIDVWGKVRRSIESSQAQAQASAADLANARLSMQAELATAYFELRGADSLHDLLADTVAQYDRSLAITRNQYSAGVTARSDVITAQAQMLAAKAQLLNTGIARSQYEHAIAVLIGRPPADISIRHRKLSTSVPRVPVRLPSTLLERRPDIAAAERTMQQQNAQIGVAIAAYYPDISLSGAFGISGTRPFTSAYWAANPAWSMGLSVAQTLFNGGQTKAQVDAAKAGYDASVATYRQTVLTAFQQVEDQLSAIRILGQQERIQIQAVSASRQAVQIALNEYRAGTQNFTTVVTAEATSLSNEQSLLTTRQQRALATVNLILALGGGWDSAQLPQ